MEIVANQLVGAVTNIQGGGTQGEKRGCSFKEFNEHPYPTYDGNLRSIRVESWLMNIEELLTVTDFTTKQKVKYVTCELRANVRLW